MDIRDVQSRGTDPADESRTVESSSSAWPTERPLDDPVSLSDRAQALEDARRAALDVPDVRTDRVEALRRQIQTGSLVPDPDRIARALLGQGAVEA